MLFCNIQRIQFPTMIWSFAAFWEFGLYKWHYYYYYYYYYGHTVTEQNYDCCYCQAFTRNFNDLQWQQHDLNTFLACNSRLRSAIR